MQTPPEVAGPLLPGASGGPGANSWATLLVTTDRDGMRPSWRARPSRSARPHRASARQGQHAPDQRVARKALARDRMVRTLEGIRARAQEINYVRAGRT